MSVDENISDRRGGLHRLELLCLNSRTKRGEEIGYVWGMMDEFGGDK